MFGGWGSDGGRNDEGASSSAPVESEEDLQTYGSVDGRELRATYTFSYVTLEIGMLLADVFPLRTAGVEERTRVGMSESRCRKTLLAMANLLHVKDGTLVEAVELWREGTDVEGRYGEHNYGGEDDEIDNGHGGDGMDVEGAIGEAEDTNGAGDGYGGRREEDEIGYEEDDKRGEEFRRGDVDGMVERSRGSAMGNVHVYDDESSEGGEEEEGSIGKGIEESGDGSTTEG